MRIAYIETINAQNGTKAKKMKAGHFYIQKEGKMYDISMLNVGKNGPTVANHLIGSSGNGPNIYMMRDPDEPNNSQKRTARIRAAWLNKHDINHILDQNKDTTDPVVHMLSDIKQNNFAADIRDNESKKYSKYLAKWQILERGTDYNNLKLHHEGHKKMARNTRLNEQNDYHMRPGVNQSQSWDKNGVEYWPRYELTSPNVATSSDIIN